MFNESILREYFYFIRECPISGETIYSWDYGIFDHNGELVMVVDIDGKYFHADDRDYDGIHSKEELDEKRSLSLVNSEIKSIIFQESNMKKSFDNMIHNLLLDYDQLIDELFISFRRMPFPQPQFTDDELIKSVIKLIQMPIDDLPGNLNINTRLGDRVIQHFHGSIWRAHTAGNISPYEAWYNDDLLKKCIRNRTIYQSHLNPNKILQGFNVSKIAPKVSVFSAGRAKIIISKYLSEFDTIFDPFSGFSGRMLGAFAANKEYIGQDLGLQQVNESNMIINFIMKRIDLWKNAYHIEPRLKVSQRNILDSRGNYPCLFTCPPYGDKEQWQDVPADKRSCDDWIGICLHNFNCQRYVFVVDSTQRYTEYIVDEIVNKSHFGANKEYVLVINK